MNKEDNRMFYEVIGKSIQDNKEKLEKLENQLKRCRRKNKQQKEELDKYKYFIETIKENLELIEKDKIAVNLLSLPNVLLKRIQELEKGE